MELLVGTRTQTFPIPVEEQPTKAWVVNLK